MNFEEYVENISEALKKKRVVRKNKAVWKWKTTRPGKYRVEYDANGKPKEVRITAKERRNRKLGQKKGKIKRAAKQNMIELKRKKSFKARQNMGLAYNKKLPDIVQNRKPYVPKQTGNKPLAPKFEGYCSNFQEFINEQLLLEWPMGIIWTDDTKGIEIGWDFCSETTPEDGEWLEQLVTLYKYGYLETLRDDRNQPANEDGFFSYPHIEFNDSQIADVTDYLCKDDGFLQQANNDYKLITNKKLLADLNRYIPTKLLYKIVK